MKILFAVDLSEPESVTSKVEEIARRMDAELLVLHVRVPTPAAPVAPVDPMSGLMGFSPYSVYDPNMEENIQKAEADAFHAYLVERFKMPVHAASRDGTPDKMILQDAEEVGADMIVLGKRHQSKLQRLLVGSIAGEVVRHSTIPVILIPVIDDDADRA